METVGDTEVALVLMFTVNDADLFHSRPTFWPFSTHLEGVTSQVVCFVSIYKPLCVKEEEKQTVLWQLCKLWSIYLRKEGVRERDTRRERGGEKWGILTVAGMLGMCDLASSITSNHF